MNLYGTRAGRLLWIIGAFCLVASVFYETGYGNGVYAGVHARLQHRPPEPDEE